MRWDYSYLSYILGSFDDPDALLYEMTAERLFSTGLIVLVRMPDYLVHEDYSLYTLMDAGFHIDQSREEGYSSWRNQGFRNNLTKPFLFSDETYRVEIRFEQKVLWTLELTPNSWRQQLQEIPIRELTKQLSWAEKLRLYQWGFMRVMVQGESRGRTRTQLYTEGFMDNALSYAQKIFRKFIMDKFSEEYRMATFISTAKKQLLGERLALWDSEAQLENFLQNKFNITFRRFEIDNLIEYYNFCDLFFQYQNNREILVKAKKLAQSYSRLVELQIASLKNNDIMIMGKPKLNFWRPRTWWYLWQRG